MQYQQTNIMFNERILFFFFDQLLNIYRIYYPFFFFSLAISFICIIQDAAQILNEVYSIPSLLGFKL
jgi:hypothetical protein